MRKEGRAKCEGLRCIKKGEQSVKSKRIVTTAKPKGTVTTVNLRASSNTPLTTLREARANASANSKHPYKQNRSMNNRTCAASESHSSLLKNPAREK
jgi:hypothetical protein